MERRTLLAAAASMPAWLSLGFAQAPRPAADGTKRVANAIERAKRVGKPLLVLLVPSDDALIAERGQMWGHYLANLSHDEALDLVLCEVTCARAGDIMSAMQVGKLDAVDETTWAVLIETEVEPARAVLVRGKLPTSTTSMRDGPPDSLRVELAKLLRTAIVRDTPMQARRVTQCGTPVADMKHIGTIDASEDFATFESLSAGAPVRRRDLDRWAAYVRFVHGEQASAPIASDHIRLLADAARIRFFESAPEGSTWMTSSMHCPPCGMGHVPPSARHFLKFFVQ